jgi:AcrR family transcriptional regulator
MTRITKTGNLRKALPLPTSRAPAITDETPGDFRTRSAARKRERMRARLLAATMEVCSRDSGPAAVIEDVLRQAGASRATFYSHFKTFEEAISHLGRDLADETVRGLAIMYQGVDDRLLLTAAGPQLILARAAIEPSWGRVVARSTDFSSRSALINAMRVHIDGGRKNGTFHFTNLEAAVDLHLAATQHGARRVAEKKRGRMAYARDLSQMLLEALGAPSSKAQAAADWALDDLRRRAPQYLPWWREFS